MGKVKLLGVVGDGMLPMQLKVQKDPEAEHQDIVLASDCGKPISAPLKISK